MGLKHIPTERGEEIRGVFSTQGDQGEVGRRRVLETRVPISPDAAYHGGPTRLLNTADNGSDLHWC